MAKAYRWDSPLTADDVISEFQAATNRKVVLDPWCFHHKCNPNGTYTFTLIYDRYFRKSPTYRRSYIKGKITRSDNGCLICAEVRFRKENIAVFFVNGMLVTLPIAALCTDNYDGGIGLILFALLGAGSLAWTLFTRRQSKKENPHLDMITRAARADIVNF